KVRVASADSPALTASAPVLVAGEEANIGNSGRIVTRKALDIEQAGAWRARRLVFRGEPLESIAAEVNRYNPGALRIEGDAARSKRIAGTFSADDTEALARFLEQY